MTIMRMTLITKYLISIILKFTKIYIPTYTIYVHIHKYIKSNGLLGKRKIKTGDE